MMESYTTEATLLETRHRLLEAAAGSVRRRRHQGCSVSRGLSCFPSRAILRGSPSNRMAMMAASVAY